MKAEDVQYMFAEMVQRSEKLFLSSLREGGADDRLLHLPALMGALASIVKELPTVIDKRRWGNEGERKEGECIICLLIGVRTLLIH